MGSKGQKEELVRRGVLGPEGWEKAIKRDAYWDQSIKKGDEKEKNVGTSGRKKEMESSMLLGPVG